jgi:hypothetical protein
MQIHIYIFNSDFLVIVDFLLLKFENMFSGGYFGSGRHGGEVHFYLSANCFAVRMQHLLSLLVGVIL